LDGSSCSWRCGGFERPRLLLVQLHIENTTPTLSSSTFAMISSKVKEEKGKQSEESLRKVMYL
jgi:hypothetical protein